MAAADDSVVSKSILELAERDAESLDWFSIPREQRIIDDETLAWISDVPPDLLDEIEDPGHPKENEEPNSKRLKLTCSPPAPSMNGIKRFVDLTCSPELAKCSKGYVPQNAQANTQWAVNTFKTWVTWRSSAKPTDPVPTDVLTCGNAQVLNKWLSLFVLEARKVDGSRYPTSTLNLLLQGLKRYMMQVNPSTSNFLDDKDPAFSGLRGTRDSVSRKLRSEGVGSTVKHIS